jgi:hypothetical protein
LFLCEFLVDVFDELHGAYLMIDQEESGGLRSE